MFPRSTAAVRYRGASEPLRARHTSTAATAITTTPTMAQRVRFTNPPGASSPLRDRSLARLRPARSDTHCNEASDGPARRRVAKADERGARAGERSALARWRGLEHPLVAVHVVTPVVEPQRALEREGASPRRLHLEQRIRELLGKPKAIRAASGDDLDRARGEAPGRHLERLRGAHAPAARDRLRMRAR